MKINNPCAVNTKELIEIQHTTSIKHASATADAAYGSRGKRK